MLRPSYRSGFYSPIRGGVAKYPALWRNCVGAWTAGLGATGLTFYDHSLFRRDGVLTGMDAATDWVNSEGSLALDLDGSNDYVSIDNPIRPVRSLTVSAWFCVNATPSYAPIVCCPRQFTSWTHPYLSILLRINSSTSMEADVGNASNYSVFNATIPTVVTGVWNHIAMTYDGVTVVAYYGGMQKGANTNISGNISYTGQPILFGRSGGPEYANAKIDDIRIYDMALSPSAIRLLSTRRGIAYELQALNNTKAAPLSLIGDMVCNDFLSATVAGSAISSYTLNALLARGVT